MFKKLLSNICILKKTSSFLVKLKVSGNVTLTVLKTGSVWPFFEKDTHKIQNISKVLLIFYWHFSIKVKNLKISWLGICFMEWFKKLKGTYGCPNPKFGPLLKMQPHSPNIIHSVFLISFWPEVHWEPHNNGGLLSLVKNF